MDKAFFVIVCCFMFFIPLCSTAGDNPFISREPQKKDYGPPAYTSKFFTKLVVLQQRLNQELARLTKELKTSGQKKALIPLILISFIYGIIHAAGPGHGKTISFSYFLSRRAPVKKGIVLGNLISFLHAFSGVVIVLSIYFIFKTSYLSSFEATSQKIKVISYSLIVLIGTVLLIKSLIDLRKSRLKNEDTGFAARPVDHKGIFPIAIAVGMIPCPGVVIIMLFTLSQHLLAVGLLLSFFMALGMAMTISAAGILSILAHKGVLKGFSGRHKGRLFIQKGLTFFGSLLIILFGMVLLIGVL